ncbi:MAG: PEP-CTERM sorting domain-containing protein [Planctomycetes bacterium]|nr:PEP-CTERM sorting domain-containing protein [Planctomycetota bacterium]
MLKRVSLWLLCVFAIAAVVAMSGNLRAGEWVNTPFHTDDLSSYSLDDWDNYYYAYAGMSWSEPNENVEFAGVGMAIDLVDEAIVAPIEDVEVTCVIHMGTPDQNLYIGPVIRATVAGYVEGMYLAGQGYAYTLSGYTTENQSRTGEVSLFSWAGVETGDADELVRVELHGSDFKDTDVWVKFSARTTSEGYVQLDGMMSLFADFHETFGDISYLDSNLDTMVTDPGLVGFAGVGNSEEGIPMSGTFDDLAVHKHSGPGDANGDNNVDLLDLGVVGDHWNATGVGWAEGDFNYDGTVDLLDLGVVGDNWNTVYTEGTASAVPEPSTLTLLVLGAIAALLYRGKRSSL